MTTCVLETSLLMSCGPSWRCPPPPPPNTHPISGCTQQRELEIHVLLAPPAGGQAQLLLPPPRRSCRPHTQPRGQVLRPSLGGHAQRGGETHGGALQGEGGSCRLVAQGSTVRPRRQRRGGKDRRGRGDLKVAPRPGSALLPLLAAKLLAAGFGEQWASCRKPGAHLQGMGWWKLSHRLLISREGQGSCDLGDRKGLGWP